MTFGYQLNADLDEFLIRQDMHEEQRQTRIAWLSKSQEFPYHPEIYKKEYRAKSCTPAGHSSLVKAIRKCK